MQRNAVTVLVLLAWLHMVGVSQAALQKMALVGYSGEVKILDPDSPSSFTWIAVGADDRDYAPHPERGFPNNGLPTHQGDLYAADLLHAGYDPVLEEIVVVADVDMRIYYLPVSGSGLCSYTLDTRVEENAARQVFYSPTLHKLVLTSDTLSAKRDPITGDFMPGSTQLFARQPDRTWSRVLDRASIRINTPDVGEGRWCGIPGSTVNSAQVYAANPALRTEIGDASDTDAWELIGQSAGIDLFIRRSPPSSVNAQGLHIDNKLLVVDEVASATRAICLPFTVATFCFSKCVIVQERYAGMAFDPREGDPAATSGAWYLYYRNGSRIFIKQLDRKMFFLAFDEENDRVYFLVDQSLPGTVSPDGEKTIKLAHEVWYIPVSRTGWGNPVKLVTTEKIFNWPKYAFCLFPPTQ